MRRLLSALLRIWLEVNQKDLLLWEKRSVQISVQLLTSSFSLFWMKAVWLLNWFASVFLLYFISADCSAPYSSWTDSPSPQCNLVLSVLKKGCQQDWGQTDLHRGCALARSGRSHRSKVCHNISIKLELMHVLFFAWFNLVEQQSTIDNNNHLLCAYYTSQCEPDSSNSTRTSVNRTSIVNERGLASFIDFNILGSYCGHKSWETRALIFSGTSRTVKCGHSTHSSQQKASWHC